MTRRFVVAACAAVLAGAASAALADPRDPLELMNRGVDALNHRVDEAALKPLAKLYKRALPSLVRRGVSNFFANLDDAWSAANSMSQFKPVDAAQNGMRFAVNTVFGLGGVLDIATDAGIERHKEDFGATLAHWGVPAGPYMVLPLLGPSTLRDTAALPVDWAGHPLGHVSPAAERNAIAAAEAIDTRGRLLPMDAALDLALDRYAFMRDAYLQHRNSQVHGGPDESDDAAAGTDTADRNMYAESRE